MAKIEIILDAIDNASPVLKGLGGALDGLAGIAKGALTIGLGAATAAIGAMGAGLAISLNEAIDAEKIQARLAAVIKSTGGAAGITADEANALAMKLRDLAGGSDDAVIAAESILLRYTNIGEDVFPQATETALNLAAALGTNASDAAEQLGRSLSDIEGGSLGLLARSRLLSKELIEQATVMAKAGDAAGAQKLILDALATATGGAAAAAAGTFAGQMEIMRGHLLEVAEGIGNTLLPVLGDLMGTIAPLAQELADGIGAFFAREDVQAGIKAIADGIKGLIESFAGGDFSAITDLIPIEVMEMLPDFEAALANLGTAFQEQLPAMRASGEAFVTWIQDAFTELSPQLIGNITTAVNAMAELWREHGAQIMEAVRYMFEVITVTIGGALLLVSGIVTAALQLLQGDWRGALDTMGATLTAFMESVLSIVGTNMAEFTATWQANWDMAILIVTTIWQNIKDAVAAKLMELTSGIQTWIINIINTLKAYYETFKTIGGELINNVLIGIQMKVSQVIGAVQDMVKDAIAAAGKALGAAPLFAPGITTQPRGRGGVGGFALGGIASGPESGYAALLHGTEAIIPLSDGRNVPVVVSGMGSGSTTIHNIITLDGRVIFENFVKEAGARGMQLSPVM